jgi:hypothetical protein
VRCPEVLKFEDDFLEGGGFRHLRFPILGFGGQVVPHDFRGTYRDPEEIITDG